MIEDYFRQLERTIAETVGVHSSHITYDKRSTTIGFVRGDIYFTDGSLLHLREFVSTERGIERYMYVYHYQRTDGTLVFRYDSAPHVSALSSFPHHKHDGSDAHVIEAPPADLNSVLEEITSQLSLPSQEE